MKPILLGLLLAILAGSSGLSRLYAQTVAGSKFAESQPGLFDAASSPSSPSPTPAARNPAEAAPSGPTTIDSQTMDYDEKTRVAIFSGEHYGVFLKDPQFTVYCGKLTAHMRTAGGAAGPKAKVTPTPQPSPASKADAAASKASGLKSALAEGTADEPVVIVQDKAASNGDEAQHNVGIAEKADYNADTGDVILTGWPRVTQGLNTQIATSETTVMIMNKDGKTMKTKGPSRSTIHESEPAKKTGTASESQESPAPSAQ